MTALRNGPGIGRCSHRELRCCRGWQNSGRIRADLHLQYPQCRLHVEHPDTQGSRGRDQLLLGTEMLHPAAASACSDGGQRLCLSFAAPLRYGSQLPHQAAITVSWPSRRKRKKEAVLPLLSIWADLYAPLPRWNWTGCLPQPQRRAGVGCWGMLLSVGAAAEATLLSCPGPLSL